MTRSRTSIDQAGERVRESLRQGLNPAREDLAIVEEFRAEYVDLVLFVQGLLTGVEGATRETAGPALDAVKLLVEQGFAESDFLGVASRPKTVGSIVAKLGRESTRLTQMQDVAGGRIVVPLILLQEAVSDALVHSFRNKGLPVRVTDTTHAGDAHGYRAVHVIPVIDGKPVEIQIRTAMQNQWAQLVERLDQRFGWDLKHGDGPDEWSTWLRLFSDVAHTLDLGESENPQALLLELPSPPVRPPL